MLYAIVAKDIDNSAALRAAARSDHIARLVDLRCQGRLILAGPFPSIDSPVPGAAGFSGSLIVAEFEDLTQARDWAQCDPYVSAGVYADVVVKPFKQVLP